jgi:hypothetical protein
VLDTAGKLRALNIETGRVVNTWETQQNGVVLPQVRLRLGLVHAPQDC